MADAGSRRREKGLLLALTVEADQEDIPRVIRESSYLAALATGRRAGQAMVVFKAEVDAGKFGLVPAQEMAGALARLDEAQRRKTEELGMMAGLIPCVLSVATRAVRADALTTAKEEAERLVAACRATATQSAAPDRWDLMADLIERTYVLGHSPDQISDWTNSVPEPQPESFKVLARLAASANGSPSEAVAAMLAVMPHLCACFPPRTAIHQELLVPFVVSYWTYKFEHQRCLFGHAMVLESQLPTAVNAPAHERVVAVFRALHTAFKFSGPMPEEIRRWLYSST